MKSKIPVLVIGSGSHAKIVIDILEMMDDYQINGIITKEKTDEKEYFGYPIIGTDEDLPKFYKNGITHVVMGVGGFTDNHKRESLFNNLKQIGFTFVNVIHPSVIISQSAIIGEGCVFLAGVIINPDVKIGNNVIIYTNSSVDHESIICDHVLISIGCDVGGNVMIKNGALLAIGSVIVSGLSIGKYSVIGAGAVVLDSIPNYTKAIGVPAKNFTPLR